MRDLMAKGFAGTVFLTTDDCQASYEELQRPRRRVRRAARGAAVRHRRRVPRPVRQQLPPHPGQRAGHQLTAVRPSGRDPSLAWDRPGIRDDPRPVRVVRRDDDRQQRGAVRSGRQLTRTGIEGEDPVDDAGPGHHVDTPLVQRGDGDRGPQQIGVAGRAATERLAEKPPRIVGLVRDAGDLGVDLGQPVAVEGHGVAVQRLDDRGRDLVPPCGERRVVGRDLAQQRRAGTRRGAGRSTPRGRPTGWCTPTSRRARRRRWRRAVAVDEAAVAVLDLGHHGDVGDRLAVEPVGGQRVARHDPLPHVDVAGRPHRRVGRAGDDADAPRAVVGRQQQQRHRVVVLQRRAERRRQRAVGRAEVAAVVDEAAVLAAPRSGGRAPSAASHCGSAERRPLASTTRSARSSSPPRVTTPATCGTPGTVDAR